MNSKEFRREGEAAAVRRPDVPIAAARGHEQMVWFERVNGGLYFGYNVEGNPHGCSVSATAATLCMALAELMEITARLESTMPYRKMAELLAEFSLVGNHEAASKARPSHAAG